MLAYVPYIFDAYRTVKDRLQPLLAHLVGHADQNGRTWVSARTLGALRGKTKSTTARHLSELVRDGHVTRQHEKRPGGGWHYVYTVAAQFLPAARHRSGVPKHERAVSQNTRTEENTLKKKEDLPEIGQWRSRLRAWDHSGGKFWNAFWGPKPNEEGCWVPQHLLQAPGRAS